MIDDADGALLLTAPAGGGNFANSALEKAFDLPRAFPSIIDGRVQEAYFEVAFAAGVDLVVLGRPLFEYENLSARARARASDLLEFTRP